VWNPHSAKNINVLESVNQQATHWAEGSRWDSFSQQWPKSSDDYLSSLHWFTVANHQNCQCIPLFCTTITPPSNLIHLIPPVPGNTLSL